MWRKREGSEKQQMCFLHCKLSAERQIKSTHCNDAMSTYDNYRKMSYESKVPHATDETDTVFVVVVAVRGVL